MRNRWIIYAVLMLCVAMLMSCSDMLAELIEKNYTVTVSDMSNGSVTASNASASSGDEVTLTVTPSDGYEMDEISVEDGDGNEVELTEVTGGAEYTFTMPAGNVRVYATFIVASTVTYSFHETVEALPAGTGGTYGTEGTYVYFGDWPQTIKDEDVTVDEEESMTMGGHTYYAGSDGYWYAKALENGCESSYKYSDGTSVAQESAGSYKYFRVEPIKWRVLTDDYSGKMLLLAENILTTKVPYYYSDSVTRSVGTDTEINPNNYKYSQIRAYLNGLGYYNDSNESVGTYSEKGFLQSAFTEAAQNKIADTTVDNSGESTTDSAGALPKATSYACANTTDKIFLLSEKEVTTSGYGFAAYCESGTGNARIRATTDYAKANNAWQSSTSGYGGWWWLRSPLYNDSICTRDVYGDGDAGYVGDVNDGGAGVVPALSISAGN